MGDNIVILLFNVNEDLVGPFVSKSKINILSLIWSHRAFNFQFRFTIKISKIKKQSKLFICVRIYDIKKTPLHLVALQHATISNFFKTISIWLSLFLFTSDPQIVTFSLWRISSFSVFLVLRYFISLHALLTTGRHCRFTIQTINVPKLY